MKAYIIDRFVDESEAYIGVQDLAIQRGFAVFDFMRTIKGQPVFLEAHLERFFGSANALHLQGLPSQADVKKRVLELIHINPKVDSGIRMMFTGGYSSDGYHPGHANLILVQKALTAARMEQYQQGIKLISHVYRRELPGIKSINYLMGVWMLRKMEAEAADDILYHYNGKVSELPRANIFMVNDRGEIITPANHILPGITRAKIIELQSPNIRVEDFDLEYLKNAKEVFVTSTTKKVLPVRQIDEKIIGDGKPGIITTQLGKLLDSYVDDYLGR